MITYALIAFAIATLEGLALAFDAIGFFSLMRGGCLGGKLVYGHGIGQGSKSHDN